MRPNSAVGGLDRAAQNRTPNQQVAAIAAGNAALIS